MFQLKEIQDFGYVEYLMPDGSIERVMREEQFNLGEEFNVLVKMTVADKVTIFYSDGSSKIIKDRYNTYSI